MFLTRRQRNEIFGVLTSNGLDPARCDLVDQAPVDPDAVDIVHQATQSHVKLWRSAHQDRYGGSMIVGGADWRDLKELYWREMLEGLAAWAAEVRYETDTPDLWAELQQVPQVLAAVQAPDASNAPFTPDEQAEIFRRFDEIKSLVRRENPELPAEQLSTIEETLDEVKEATTRVGRKDWVLLANGALLGLIVNGLVPPHVVQIIFNVLITGIGHLLGIGGPPPIISS